MRISFLLSCSSDPVTRRMGRQADLSSAAGLAVEVFDAIELHPGASLVYVSVLSSLPPNFGSDRIMKSGKGQRWLPWLPIEVALDNDRIDERCETLWDLALRSSPVILPDLDPSPF